MDNTTLPYLIAYAVVGVLSTLVPILSLNYPRVAGLMQVLAALGVDLPRFAEGLRKLASGDRSGAAGDAEKKS